MFEYPDIVLKVVQFAQNTFQPGFLIEPDWVCMKLYFYQSNLHIIPSSESAQDLVFLAEEISPRSSWSITHEHFDFAKKKWSHNPLNPLSNRKTRS